LIPLAQSTPTTQLPPLCVSRHFWGIKEATASTNTLLLPP
jgi:hypothetical protein